MKGASSARRTTLLVRKQRKCVLCRSTRQIEMHHWAGRSFELTVALCHECHRTITVGLSRLKVNTSLSGDLIDSLQATNFLQWKLIEHLKVTVGENTRKIRTQAVKKRMA